MSGSDELTAEELAYLESGGRSELSIEPNPSPEPQNEDVTGEGGGHGGDAPVVTQGAGEPSEGQETASDDEDGGDSLPEGVTIRVGKDGRPRLVGPDGKFVKSVPHSALHKERERRKQTRAELEELKVKYARADERLAILNDAVLGKSQQNGQQQQQEQPKNPLDEPNINPDEDLLGAFRQMQRRTSFLQQQQSQFTQAQTARDAFSQVTQNYHADAQRVMQEKPDFRDAYTHLVETRMKELEFLGMTDPEQRKQTVIREEADIVISAMKSGKSPAEVIYNFAVARGFRPNAAPPANGAGAPSQKTPAQQKIEQVRNGQNAAQTLSNTGGASHEGLTMAGLANMSDDEFARVVDTMSKSQLEQFLGR